MACLQAYFSSLFPAEPPKYFSPIICTSEPARRLVFLIRNRLNQEYVELNFFGQRKMRRGTTDLTACKYGYNISSQLKHKAQFCYIFFLLQSKHFYQIDIAVGYHFGTGKKPIWLFIAFECLGLEFHNQLKRLNIYCFQAVREISISGCMMTSLIIASWTCKDKLVCVTLLGRYYFASFHLCHETRRYL